MRQRVRAALTRPMGDTLAELSVSTRATPPIDLRDTSLRSRSGHLVMPPMGSSRPAHDFDDRPLGSAQLAARPRRASEAVNLRSVPGRWARRPVRLARPRQIRAMAHGVAVTGATRRARARASGAVVGRRARSREPQILRQAEMIEVQAWLGAMPGQAIVAPPDAVGPERRQRIGLGVGARPVIHVDLCLEDPERPATLAAVARHLREGTEGVPTASRRISARPSRPARPGSWWTARRAPPAMRRSR